MIKNTFIKKNKYIFNKKKIVIILAFIISFFLLLYVVGFRISIDLSLPPGCTGLLRTETGFTGCFSTRTIPLFISYSPQNCLRVSSNSCAEPSIKLNNNCRGGVTVKQEKYQVDTPNIYVGKGFFFISGKIDNKSYFVFGFATWDLC